MDFDHGFSELNFGEESYPVGAAERFAAALQQFVWSSERHLSNEASQSFIRARAACSPTIMEGEGAMVPLYPRHTTHILQALRSVLDSARHCSSQTRADPVTEAGLFMMRFTRLLEQRTLAQVQEEMKLCLGNSTTSACVALPARNPTATCDEGSELFAVKRSALRGPNTVRSCGRRHTVSESSSSLPPSPSSALDVSTPPDSRAGGTGGKTNGSIWRFHADLTLELQQCMLQNMCLLDSLLTDHSADDRGLCGILTHPCAAKLQEMFIDAIAETLTATLTKWSAEAAIAGSTEAVREVSAVAERLQQAVRAQHRTGALPQLHVHELSTAESTRRSPPPFASRKRSSSFLSTDHEGVDDFECADAASPPGHRSEIEKCLGVIGADYATKLVAQQLWCAQKLLSQRFPSYAASWDLLERARFVVESTRSPTPTVPRSDNSEHISGSSVSAAMPPSGNASPERTPQHDGGTPPPYVTTTQFKSERPVDADKSTSPPFRSLTYSEDPPDTVVGADDVYTDTTLSSSRRPTASHPVVVHHGSTVPRLLPVAQCILWENFLADCGVSAGATVAAIQQLTDDPDTSLPCASSLQQRGHPNESLETHFLLKKPLNQQLRRQTMSKRTKTYSIETAHCVENSCSSFPSQRLHARSS